MLNKKNLSFQALPGNEIKKLFNHEARRKTCLRRPAFKKLGKWVGVFGV